MNFGMSTVAVYCRRAMVFRLRFCFGELPTDVSELPDSEMDWPLRDGDPIDLHPKMAHALRPMRVGAYDGI